MMTSFSFSAFFKKFFALLLFLGIFFSGGIGVFAEGTGTTETPAAASQGSSSAGDKAKEPPLEFKILKPFPGQATTGSDGKTSDTGTISTEHGAIGIIEQYVSQIFTFGAGFVSIIAVIWIIIGGYQYMMEGSFGGETTAAKEKITKALSGLVLLFLSALILYTINPTFFKFESADREESPPVTTTPASGSGSSSSSGGS